MFRRNILVIKVNNNPDITFIFLLRICVTKFELEYQLSMYCIFNYFAICVMFSYKQTIHMNEVFHFKPNPSGFSFLLPSFEIIDYMFSCSDFHLFRFSFFISHRLTKKSDYSGRTELLLKSPWEILWKI